jgi:hypothetical protein
MPVGIAGSPCLWGHKYREVWSSRLEVGCGVDSPTLYNPVFKKTKEEIASGF